MTHPIKTPSCAAAAAAVLTQTPPAAAFTLEEPVQAALVLARQAALNRAGGDEAEPLSADHILDQAIAVEEKGLNDLLNAIVSRREFRNLESLWASLEALALDPEGSGVEIKLINQPLSAVEEDLQEAGTDKERSELFRRIVREGYLKPGAAPTTTLTLTDPVGLKDLKLLLDIGGLAETGHFMVLVQAKAELLAPDAQSFAELSTDIQVLKDDAAGDERLAPLRNFRQDSRSRRIVCFGPRYLPRPPYHPLKNPAQGAASFTEEFTLGTAPWTSVSTVLSHRIAASLTRWETASQIVGECAGGKHLVPVCTDEYGRHLQALEVALCDDKLEKTASDLGFVIAQPYARQGFVVIFIAKSMFNAPDGSLDAEVAYRLINDQIAKDIKRLLRAAVGLNLETADVREMVEAYLRALYCTANSGASFEELARRPLENVEATVTNPVAGVFHAQVKLYPHVKAKRFFVETQLAVPSTDNHEENSQLSSKKTGGRG